MKVIKLSLVLAFFGILSSMCQAMVEEIRKLSTYSPSSSATSPATIRDEQKPLNGTNGASRSLPHHNYDAESIIKTIQASSKKNYFEKDLLIVNKLFEKIHDCDQEIIEEFKKVLRDITKESIDNSSGGGYVIDYNPISNKVFAYISDPH